MQHFNQSSYFMATKIGQPDARHLYSVTDMESTKPREIQCLSCNFHRFCIHNDGEYYFNMNILYDLKK